MTNDPSVELSPEFTASLARAAIADLEDIACAYGEVNITCKPLPDGSWGYSVTIACTNPKLAPQVATSNPEPALVDAYRSAIVLAQSIKLQSEASIV